MAAQPPSPCECDRRISDRIGISVAYATRLRLDCGLAFEKGHDGHVSLLCGRRLEAVAQAIKENWTLQDLGNALDITRERARQIKNEYLSRHGEPDGAVRCSTIWEIAKSSGLTRRRIMRAATSLGLAYIRGLNTTVVDSDNVQDVIAAARDSMVNRNACSICGDRLSGQRKSLCGKRSCIFEYRRRSHSRSSATNALDGRDCEARLIAKRISERPPANGKWAGLVEAERITGLSRMQIVWLGNRSAVRTRDSHTRNWRGRPCVDYCLADLRVAAQIKRSK